MTRWERFCIVGIGGHASTKLIPAIQANGQAIAGLVSRKPPETFPEMPVFSTLDSALAVLPRDTAIVIASPPGLHHSQACAALASGFDVVVEKPAFVTAAEARDAVARCEASGTILVEAFMQRHTELYRRLLAYFKANEVVELELAFVVPELPAATFRSQNDLASSSLYDIGCYILALLGDLNLDLGQLDIVEVREAGTMRESLEMAGRLDDIAVRAVIGVGPEYRNIATVRLGNGDEADFHPLFYGRPGVRTGGNHTIEDGNAFEAMFTVHREQWLADQSARLAGMISVAQKLEALAAQLAGYRAGSR